MLEMYLFINPLGAKCYEAEQNILQLAEESSQKFQIRFIPLLNLQSVTKVMSVMNVSGDTLQLRNKVSQILYNAVLDYKAALFQGRKRGHRFLLNVQRQLYVEHKKYSEEVVIAAAKESNLDLAMFDHDRRSKLVAESFKEDQRLAAEMNISTPPSIVIYNLDYLECAISIEDMTSLSCLKELISGDGKELICSKDESHLDFHQLSLKK